MRQCALDETYRVIARARHAHPDGGRCPGVVSTLAGRTRIPAGPGRSRHHATADGTIVPREEDLDWSAYVGWFEAIGVELSWVGPCPGCGQRKRLTGAAVVGRHRPDKACTPRCESAVGPSCECACAGLNHGAAHAA